MGVYIVMADMSANVTYLLDEHDSNCYASDIGYGPSIWFTR